MASIENLNVFSEAIRANATKPKDSLTNAESDRAACAAQWRSQVEDQLTEWEKGVKTADEDGYLPPAQQAIAAALRVAAELRVSGVPAPLRMVQDGAGGIVFEWKQGSVSDKLRLDRDGIAEATGFCDSRLVYRCSVSVS